MIDLQSVSKSYRIGNQELPILKDVSLQVPKNEWISIVGPSGSGKSTLISILGCLDRVTNGRYFLGQRDVSQLTNDELAEIRNTCIGFVFQNFNLLPYYSALYNVELPMIYKGIPDSRERAQMLLERVKLGHRLHHRPSELSGGERQRVAIARSLANAPEILIADEPTGNLDSTTGKEILTIFKQLHQEGATIVLVTHDPAVARWSQRSVRIMDGRIQ